MRSFKNCIASSTNWVVLLLLFNGRTSTSDAFFVPVPPPSKNRNQHAGGATLQWSSRSRSHARTHSQSSSSSSSTTKLNMVFDFFRERSKEGLDQLSNLSDKAQRGQLGQGLAEAATYTQQTNRAFAEGLAKSRNRLLQDLESVLTGVSPDEVLEELQDILLQADLGAQTAEDIVAEVRSLREDATQRLSQKDLKSIMRGKLMEALDTGKSRAIRFQEQPDDDDEPLPIHIPTVLFVMGANGMGKTTTIGKLAHRLQTEGNQTVLMAACDTFRAGAVDQLQQWADRAGCSMVGPDDRASTPAAVLYRALDRAVADRVDTVLVDTSGRLSNNDALTQELLKMKRVIQKRLSIHQDDNGGAPVPNGNVPHETLLVLDAAQGRMALDSARAWDEAVGLTGLILTKLDGSARGGSVVAVSRDLGLPVKLIGVGEGLEDLRDFEPESFVDGLLGIGVAGGKGGSSNEGAMLASRLVEMRREREMRAKQTKASTKREPVGVAAAAPPQPVAASTATAAAAAAPPRNPNRPKNKKRKKRKAKK